MNIAETLQKLNDIDKNIEFTMEKPSIQSKFIISGLHHRFKWKERITKVYRKTTHTGQYTHFSSNQLLHVKVSTIKNLVRKAKFIGSDQTLSEELLYIRKAM